MKKTILFSLSLVLLPVFAFGGGLVTNTNQSAAWVRTLTRDASLGIDAVYFNPAGLVKLSDGFHFSLNSQTIFQTKDVTDSYQFLSGTPKTYAGNVKAPVFPGVYAAWKMGKLAVSFGFNPIGGGGGAEYKTGLPSFERSIADLKPIIRGSLASLDANLDNDPPLGYGFDPMFRNITGYDADIYFKGSSIFFGYQAGISYEIFEYLSIYAGARYVSAKNTYKGHVKDISIYAEPSVPPTAYYDIPEGSYTPGNYFREVAGAAGLPVSTVNLLNGTALIFDALTADVEADVEETGNGYTPIIGANITVAENINIGLKYEFKTKLDLTTKVIDGKSAGGMFVQDSVVHADMPAMLSAGISWEFVPYWTFTAGAHYYFDRNANYGKTLNGEQVNNDLVIDKNYFEIGAGLEWDINNKLFVSGGYLFAKPGVSEAYQSDLSFGLTSSTFGIGAGYKFNDAFMLNIGGAYTLYNEGSISYSHTINSPIPADVNGIKQTYNKSNLIFAIGLDISL